MGLTRGKGTRDAVQVVTIDGETVDIPAFTMVDTSGASQSTAVDDALKLVPAGSTNGTALGTKPAGATAFQVYLDSADSITGTFATAQPSSAPTPTVTRTGAQVFEWSQLVGAGTMFYVTAIAGTPRFRWL